ncbi:MAG: ATP-binding cassette domain-containing protein, partial [Pseudomonadota bacterium]
MSTSEPITEDKAKSESSSDISNDGISARDLTVVYRNGHTALEKVEFKIPRGTITALVGINGAGKSTLF